MLQNNIGQKQYTKFHHATIAPSFYTFFYTFVVNREVWNGLSENQQSGIERAAQAAEKLAFVNEEATAIHHAAMNEALGVRIHMQTAEERTAWISEFSGKVRDGILRNSDDAAELRSYIRQIEAL
jgi:TRAP-type C4-dicarboxylate transport system substrate-binding protein